VSPTGHRRLVTCARALISSWDWQARREEGGREEGGREEGGKEEGGREEEVREEGGKEEGVREAGNVLRIQTVSGVLASA
jgi:hypothetical protein